MQNILVIGAGRSSASLIKYFVDNKESENWTITIADLNIEGLKNAGLDKECMLAKLDINNSIERIRLISQADLVVSMLPMRFHPIVAKECIALKKHMITASYISDEMNALNDEAKKAGVTILNEIGVDPGLDHLSAKKVIDKIQSKGGTLTDFETFTGGLLSPESENNPWKYKFTWNPRNVVLAGSAGAVKFIENGQFKYIPYHRVYRRTEVIKIDDYGSFEGYANRDSLRYRDVYNLNDVGTIYRGTLRRVGFCKAWNVFVQLGATDDSYRIENSEELTYREFINLFLKYNQSDSVELKLRQYLKIDQDDVELWDKLVWLDLFSDKKVGLKNATPAEILQHILMQKWSLNEDDKDMIVMWHKFIYLLNGNKHEVHSSMVAVGEDSTYTAMANTVGLPLAICAKMILNGTIRTRGVMLPIEKEIYEPVLHELESYGISFSEEEIN